ncbi:M23 family metallopeptidase [Cytobacillus massiliigabonensis]|uniref:M23 family metallopeptidase n=1 Tax=Cytobacillus massiliigabonensis TaxID=1871011 RepID=UPI001F451635|nr:M23 family metallopeptidase [Cytobacillus massiliigabonensis]
MIRVIRNLGFFNSILIGVFLLLWISVFLISGLFGAYAWTLLKIVLPIIGIIGIFLNIILFIIFLIKKKKYSKLLVNFIVNIIFTFPLLMTMNIIPFAYPNDIERVKPSITVKWPLDEPTVVGWGGDTTKNNLPHVIWSSERWAYDLVMEPYKLESNDNEDYGIWDKEVYAPVSGIVVAAYDKEADIEPGSEEFFSMEGNYVYIKIDKTGTYLLLNHLKKDSVSVEVGEHVQPGDLIGRVGNSGSTSEPHLHIHHQRQDPTKVIYPILAEGLPLFFEGIDGGAMPIKGDMISTN